METEKNNQRKPNRLINEKSSYLLQHAYNPVDWFPWGQEAFDKAKMEDKPVLVSIGYSSCHWCHVMEKECFVDEEVAHLMNEAFVCIKIDREERPDLDAAYMSVCQAMGRSCGWPLNVLMTPDKNPFFAASYIPKNSRFGLTGMLDLIPQLMDIWKTRRVELETLGIDLKARIETYGKQVSEGELGKDTLNDAYEKLALDFDAENGGFGNAPKFPMPHNMLFLLRYWRRSGEKNGLNIVEKTLRAMRLGGIFDQVGFGFHRYSTDAVWLVPHFEKMLYDQALLALAYLEAYQATGAGKFKLTAKEILEYVARDLASPEGAFYSAEDADIEGEEGIFYFWTEGEVRKAVQPEDANLATKLFGVLPEGNFEEAGRRRNGKNILHCPKPLEEIAAESGLTMDGFIAKLGRIRSALFEARKKRVAPAKDDKVLTDWNGLMIAAFARASQVIGEQKYLQAAVKASDFLLENMKGEDGTLFHRFAKGEKALEGFLDDYAFFAFGLTEVYEASFEDKYLQAASAITKAVLAKFWDEKNGGFYFTNKGGDDKVPRMKQIYDGAVPSGNSVALLNLLRLARLTNEPSYEEVANKILKAFSADVESAPQAHTFLLSSLDFALGPTFNVVLVGDLEEQDTQEMLAALRKQFLPKLTVSLRKRSQAGLGYERIGGKATAYVCRDQTCMPPTNNPAKMLELLGVP